MSNNGRNSQDRILYQKTSMRIAARIMTAYRRKIAKPITDCDLLYRLQVAHSLLLKFHHFYFSQTHNAPSIESQNWLVREVLWMMSG